MEGHRVFSDEDLPHDAYRDWAAASKFGWDLDQIDQAAALRLDWMLRVDAVVEGVEAEAKRRAQEQ